MNMMTPEHDRLKEALSGIKKWRRWGPYLSERQWGTVREDYSENGDAWGYFPEPQARSRAYRWGEDGLLGLCDNRGLLCFAPALWNGKDPVLKERLFGLSGPEGNHAEDVKECYWYLDSTPTHSYCHGLYKYPQREFPYQLLRDINAKLGKLDPEFELLDTGIFKDNAYFDVDIFYFKADANDVLIEIQVTNRGLKEAPLTVFPTFWCRNTWLWGDQTERPRFTIEATCKGYVVLRMDHFHLGTIRIYLEHADELLFTENESNKELLWGVPNDGPYVKDAFHRYVIEGEKDAVNPDRVGSKAASVHRLCVAPGAACTLRARMVLGEYNPTPFSDFDSLRTIRKQEADTFYASVMPPTLNPEEGSVYRQALSGLLWSKQYYHLDIARWLRGDPKQPVPPASRLHGRNCHWQHLYNSEVIAMPDKWEYPWYAAWDTAFHAVALAPVDIDFAKEQLILLLREWFMHPNGQLPAYEWSFGDVNPPVHAWAALRLYEMERTQRGIGDRQFLESVFHKLILNFTWWVNRKDASGRNVFEGGFLGLDNIGAFDRSNAVPQGGFIEQADATSWMGMYCLNLLSIALELAQDNRAYEDVANKFFEHFLYIANAMNFTPEGDGKAATLWDEQDGFYYDILNVAQDCIPLRVRSMVGLIPLFGVMALKPSSMDRLPGFVKRVHWFLNNRPELTRTVTQFDLQATSAHRLLSLVQPDRLMRILSRLLDENEFLSPYGIRSLSRYHHNNPYVFSLYGQQSSVSYEPGEGHSNLFGGNSNWRGPVWFPVNYLLIESIEQYARYYDNQVKVECPTGSGQWMNLHQVAAELRRRLLSLFLRNGSGVRPALGKHEKAQHDPHFRDHLLFYEYFHGDEGTGLGASHQTGWTALMARLLEEPH